MAERKQIQLEQDLEMAGKVKKLLRRLSGKQIDSWTLGGSSEDPSRLGGQLTVDHKGIRYVVSKEYFRSFERGRHGDDTSTNYHHYDYNLMAADLEEDNSQILFQEKNIPIIYFWIYGKYQSPEEFGIVAKFYERVRQRVLKRDSEGGERKRRDLLTKVFGEE